VCATVIHILERYTLRLRQDHIPICDAGGDDGDSGDDNDDTDIDDGEISINDGDADDADAASVHVLAHSLSYGRTDCVRSFCNHTGE
jgi:hypothetical protein